MVSFTCVFVKRALSQHGPANTLPLRAIHHAYCTSYVCDCLFINKDPHAILLVTHRVCLVF